jgi:glycolate oxidase FAD binding subunit
VRTLTPATVDEAADALRTADQEGVRVRLRGGGTKLGWMRTGAEADHEITSSGLDRMLDHRPGDLVAILQAGVPMAAAQEAFAGSGQMLALDPPLGTDERATVGGVIASGDSGPLRHRYGGPRDLVLGAAVVLPDGTVTRTGSKVIKNVAGYDLAKLYTGSFGTLGFIVEVVVRLHPVSTPSVTAVGQSSDPQVLQAGASAVAHAPLEPDALDVAWTDGTGEVLVRFSGGRARERAQGVASLLAKNGLDPTLDEDDAGRWEGQRSGQRSVDGTIVRASSVQSGLAAVVRAAEELGGSVVGRAGLGLFWIRLGPDADAEAVEWLRSALDPWPAVVLDAPQHVRQAVGGAPVGGARARLQEAVRRRFDPGGILVGGV